MTEATKNAIMSIIRVALAVVGGIMASKGYISGDEAVQLAAAVAILLPALWGIADKYIAERKTQARVVDALNEPRDTWTPEQRAAALVVNAK